MVEAIGEGISKASRTFHPTRTDLRWDTARHARALLRIARQTERLSLTTTAAFTRVAFCGTHSSASSRLCVPSERVRGEIQRCAERHVGMQRKVSMATGPMCVRKAHPSVEQKRVPCLSLSLSLTLSLALVRVFFSSLARRHPVRTTSALHYMPAHWRGPSG